MTVLLSVLTLLLLVQGCMSLRDGWRNARYAANWVDPHAPTRSVVVFCPVKGADADLADNARSLLLQDYANYQVVFLVDDLGDPAVAVLRSLGARVVVGGRSEGRGQKVHNLLHGVRHAIPDAEDAEVLVFADADARFPSEWLRRLVGPLAEPGVGATTGYRWYVPVEGNRASLVRSAWNASVAGFLGPHAHNFAWGGSMAITREVFFRAGIDVLWERALSDDYALTRGVRGLGLVIRYVPTCLVPAYEGCTWRELLEFTTRQIRITRVYSPRVWRLGFASYTLFNATFFWLSARILGGAWEWAVPWIAVYGLTVARAGFRIRGVRGAIRDRSLERHRLFYRLSTPLVNLLFQVNFVMSLVSRRIVWKGVRYTMVSPEETRVRLP